ncbi:MAG: alpha-galactosidase, partial [Bacteroidales bacterium]|nr:alpha-galactosidase [Bacteroidales bacterium]
LGSFEAKFESTEIEPDLEIVTVTITSEKASVPPKFSMEWNFPSIDIYQFWNSNIRTDKVTYYRNNVHSRTSSQVPLICYMDCSDQNRFTLALSDALNKINTYSWLREENSKFYFSVELFSEPHPAIKEYTLEIRIDRRNIPFYKSVRESTDWWANMDNYKPAEVLDDARTPMYSTWYSFHQNLDVTEVIRECKLGKQIGLEAIIVDDGWQTMDNKRGYAYTGDWKPERIGNMKAFVDSIHTIGMKFLLWYSLPFIGEKAELFKHFKGKYLHHWESQGTWVLDPRYPEVREHIISTYKTALTDWNLDGFKLDFLGWFYADEKTDMTATNGRDYASVNEATDRLMTDIMARLRDLKPDIMIEFRQPYIGPLMRKYGNMFRAADCPNMEVVNRSRTTDLRIASGNTAVHSDMFVWHRDDPVESAALQILNIIFSVPQLSVKLDSVPDDHLKMSHFWMNYWKENRHVLLDGDFVPVNPGGLYPVIRSSTENKEIIALYDDHIVTLDDKELAEIDIINAKGSSHVILDVRGNPGRYNVEIFDCIGKEVRRFSIKLNNEPKIINAPPSGLIRLRVEN